METRHVSMVHMHDKIYTFLDNKLTFKKKQFLYEITALIIKVFILFSDDNIIKNIQLW